jgi:hypothetical protein
MIKLIKKYFQTITEKISIKKELNQFLKLVNYKLKIFILKFLISTSQKFRQFREKINTNIINLKNWYLTFLKKYFFVISFCLRSNTSLF